MKETGTIPVCLYLLLYGISLKAPPALAFLSCLPSYFHPNCQTKLGTYKKNPYNSDQKKFTNSSCLFTGFGHKVDL